jgi:5-methylcytosine-specific restriction protein A
MPTKHGPKVDAFYHSPQWRRFQSFIVRSRHGICDICGRKGTLVHHIVPLTEENVSDPSVSLNPDNVQLLCIPCHNALHADMDSGRSDKPTVCVFGSDGSVSISERKGRK